MPVRRDVLIICVIVSRSVKELLVEGVKEWGVHEEHWITRGWKE